jgi:hypothetical protein
MNSKELFKNRTTKLCFAAFAVSMAVHLLFFVLFALKKAIHLDESMLLLNARYLADYATDCMGERLPLYFDTWLHGGQSPFATYITALFIKIFGYSLAVTRIPMLLISAVGLLAFYKFLTYVFEDKEEYTATAFILACFSPWHIFNSVYTLDCNYMPHLMIIGLALLAKGVRTQRSLFYAASMVFFGLCFYCYIAASLIVPVLLVLIYLLLLLAKKIRIRDAALSVLVIAVVSLPFILLGLIQFDIIEGFRCVFSFSKMPYYSRNTTVSTDYIFESLTGGITSLIFPDLYMTNSVGMMNTFLYTNFIGGIMLVLGFIGVVMSCAKKNAGKYGLSYIFVFPVIVSAALFCSVSFYYNTLYRFFSYNYVFILTEAIGFVFLTSLIKKIKLKYLLAVFLCVSTVFYCVSYFSIFEKNYLNNNYWYTTSFTDCLDYAQKKGFRSVCLALNGESKTVAAQCTRDAVALRLYDYENRDKYCPLEKELLAINDNRDIKLTSDDSYYYRIVTDKTVLDGDCIIISKACIDYIKADITAYNAEDLGETVVLYK